MPRTKQHKKHSNLILKRIIRNSNCDSLDTQLIGLNGADLKSLLLHVFNERSKSQSVNDAFIAYQTNQRFLGVSELDQKEIVRFQNIFFENIPKEFQAVELSPVSPLGINGILAKISQNNLCSTNRGYEIIGDPTTSLALETAVRRKKLLNVSLKNCNEVHLCTSQRILRLQSFDAEKGYMQHFRCFGLSSGGRESHWRAFLVRNLIRHIKTHLGFIRSLNANSFSIKDIVVTFSHQGITESILQAVGANRDTITKNTANPNYHLFHEYGVTLPPLVDSLTDVSLVEATNFGISQHIKSMIRVLTPVINELRSVFPDVMYRFNMERIAGIGYYNGFCFHIHGTTQSGLTLQLSDGGFTDWLKKLLNNKQELLLISGLGEDLIHKMFKKLVTSP